MPTPPIYFPTPSLQAEDVQRAHLIEETVLDDSEAAARHIVALERYAHLLSQGLSDSEARGTIWPEEG